MQMCTVRVCVQVSVIVLIVIWFLSFMTSRPSWVI